MCSGRQRRMAISIFARAAIFRFIKQPPPKGQFVEMVRDIAVRKTNNERPCTIHIRPYTQGGAVRRCGQERAASAWGWRPSPPPPAKQVGLSRTAERSACWVGFRDRCGNMPPAPRSKSERFQTERTPPSVR